MELVLNQCQMCGDLFEHRYHEDLCVKCQAEVMAYDPNDDPRDFDETETENTAEWWLKVYSLQSEYK